MKKHYNSNISQFVGAFLIPVIIVALLLIGWFFSAKADAANYYDSPNTERVYGDKRVFDYADQLTDAEEEKLEAYIHKAEKDTTCDIVIVTLNESLKDYAPEYKAGYDIPITPDKYVMVYADKFWEDNKFGYDRPQILDGTPNSGDGVLLVDNIYREPETNKIYTWMCTTGKAERTYSESMIDYVLDVFYNYVETDYYKACIEFVDRVRLDMGGIKLTGSKVTIVAAVIFTLIYLLSHLSSKAGKKTVTESSYLIGNSLSFEVNRDTFLRKNVVKHYNPPSESRSGGGGGGGGGHHSSGGGGSHGGGGHSR